MLSRATGGLNVEDGGARRMLSRQQLQRTLGAARNHRQEFVEIARNAAREPGDGIEGLRFARPGKASGRTRTG